MPVCEHCGSDNKESAKFCRQCGSPVQQSSTPDGMTRCPQCSALVRIGARFCRLCGATLNSASAQPKVCPQCHEPISANSRFCRHCGSALLSNSEPRCAKCQRPLRPNARFCPNCGASIAQPVATPQAMLFSSNVGRTSSGRLLGASTLVERYVILEQIAKGGMGAIYRAMDKRLAERIVAIKEMSETVIAPAEREHVLELFKREAELLAKLQHPNLVRVTDTFKVNDAHYMVMEYIPGKTLQALLDGKQEPYPEEQVLNWAKQLCSVLLYLHAQNPPIIYRDMKPSNIMIVDDIDEIKLIDFGIARYYKPGKRKDTIQFGTDGYAPPEQYGKAQTDIRSDVYALGAVLHQLLTLRDPQTVLFQFPPAKTLNSKISKRVSDAISRAVEPNKENRPPDVAAFWSDLTGHPAAELMTAEQGTAPDTQKGTRESDSGSLLDLGHITTGITQPHGSLRIPLSKGETAKLVSETPWLQLERTVVNADQQDVRVALCTTGVKHPCLRVQGGGIQKWADAHTRFLVPIPQTLLGRVRVERDSGVIDHIPILVHADPPGWQVTGGWAMTIGLMLTEAGVVLGTLSAVLVALSSY
ncbi:MAG: zinc ribbon domain-containing protein [Anaerolineae bacterium]|nr:zinc ribbon domain-containing protein [Anaerolineae bacterium]